MQNERILFIDLESTGLSFTDDRICQIAMILPDGTEFNKYVNPGIPIPPDITKIHGITDDMVKDAPRMSELADELIDILEDIDVFAAYNFLFDFQMLQAELHRAKEYKLEESKFTFLDPYKIFRKMFPHTLKNAYKYYTGSEFENAHNALADVQATKAVFDAQVAKYPDLFAKPLKAVEEETIGPIGILGKWFKTQNGKIHFQQGKHKNEEVSASHHEGYLKWIYGLGDTTISEKRYLESIMSVGVDY